MNNDKRFQQIVFSQDDYNNDRDKLFDVVKDFLRIILDSGHVAVVRYDEPGLGIVEVQFDHDEKNEAWGGYYPEWIDYEESCILENERNDNCSEINYEQLNQLKMEGF